MYLATALTWIAAVAALPSPAELGTRQSTSTPYYTLFARKDGDSGHGAPLYTIRNGTYPEIHFVTGRKHAGDSAQVYWYATGNGGVGLALDHDTQRYAITAFDQPAASGRTHPVRAMLRYEQAGWYQGPNGVAHDSMGEGHFFLCETEIDDQTGDDHDETALFYGMDQANGHAPKDCELVRLHLVAR
ncbi:hypothetical protein HII31_08903 [Pseudocercospora fuligena]|uniref:Uncharacterized protein n=1 Tax=Pseudocercospora fuligena TaxID=685502 RepID=A0A8H6RC06_9PEZI|nr:hypothetical protein HII31_08903 [Pseudocercospora fuligena]